MFTFGNVRFGHFSATWNAASVGAVHRATPNLKLLFEAIRINSVGRQPLGWRFTGIDDAASVTLTLAEAALTQLRAMVPWDDGSGAVDLTPPLDYELYDDAQPLVLHPTEEGASTAKDIEFFKTVPIHQIPWGKDQKGQTYWDVMFMVMPDHAKLAAGLPAFFQLKGS